MALKPHDPRAVATPEEVDAQVKQILSEPVESLAQEAAQLDKAHAVLRDVLQEN